MIATLAPAGDQWPPPPSWRIVSSRRTGHVREMSILVYQEKVMRVVEVFSREIFGGKLELNFVVADKRGFDR